MSGEPSAGRNYALSWGDDTADVDSIGASLRTLRSAGRDLVLPYRRDEIRPAFRGCVLAPWPNRIAGGRWTHGDARLQLPITEPDLGHALHGLVAWSDWHEVDVADDAVTLGTRLRAQPGYPFELELAVTWRLDEGGLHCVLGATNVGEAAAPYGCGIHPYLVAPEGRLDTWSLHLDGRSELLVDEHLIPTELVDVRPEHDFRSPRTIGDAQIDNAFTDLRPIGSEHTVTVTDANGDGARISFDPAVGWVQICTSDWPTRTGHRDGLAVEPMTCAPDAFNGGRDVICILPGDRHRTWWRIQAIGGGRRG